MPGEPQRMGNLTVHFLMEYSFCKGGSLKTDRGFATPKLQLSRTEEHAQLDHEI